MKSDSILVRGLEFYGYHGVAPEENRLGQRFIVDIEMRVDTRAAGKTDDITQTVDYAAVYREARAIVEGPPFRLIESVAERIAAVVLTDARVSQVTVRVKKPDVPLPVSLEYVGVEIVRGRE